MRQGLSESRLANLGAQAIHRAFDAFHTQFRGVSRRARERFERREWQGIRADAAERLDLYRQVVDPTLRDVRMLLGERVSDRLVWAGIKAVYSGLIADRDDWEIAETFFNSITRRIFTTVGVDPVIEFVDTDFDIPPTPTRHPVYRVYERPRSVRELISAVLDDYRHSVDYADRPRAVEDAAAAMSAQLRAASPNVSLDRVEILRPVFYRNKGAYLIGRVWSGGRLLPLAIALLNSDRGIVLDAILLDENELSIVFSFAHSYFHVDVDRPYDLVAFLRTVIPRKRVAELYISLGYHKHGKTELYRDLLECLATTEERFDFAPGEAGMVMEVFTLPTYDLVLKVIKDRFAEPKSTTRQAVMEKYHLVFRHDRAGRLVDAQEFEHLQLSRDRFEPQLLERLVATAGGTVRVTDDRVNIRHAYVERRVTPLDVYLRRADAEAARAAVLDFGQAIKDLAASNIFPGDFWLKNFGVTRHGRVVFYDYDELGLVTDCHFAPMPVPQDELEELAGEPWFYVGENDVFPEEFRTYLRMPRGLNEAFVERHADLFELRYWREMQARLHNGEVVDVFPYEPRNRLPVAEPAPPSRRR